jgi:hypothetical protein
MKKIIFAAVILTAVMAWILVYVILSDFRYDKDLAKNLSEVTETEVAKENLPMIPAQTDNTTDYEESEKLKDSKEEKDEFDWLRQKTEEEKDEFGWTRKKTEEEKDEYGWTGKKAEEEKDDNEAGVELENKKQKNTEKKILK